MGASLSGGAGGASQHGRSNGKLPLEQRPQRGLLRSIGGLPCDIHKLGEVEVIAWVTTARRPGGVVDAVVVELLAPEVAPIRPHGRVCGGPWIRPVREAHPRRVSPARHAHREAHRAGRVGGGHATASHDLRRVRVSLGDGAKGERCGRRRTRAVRADDLRKGCREIAGNRRVACSCRAALQEWYERAALQLPRRHEIFDTEELRHRREEVQHLDECIRGADGDVAEPPVAPWWRRRRGDDERDAQGGLEELLLRPVA